MAINIPDYKENNTTAVHSTTNKLVGNEVIVGDAFGGGTSIPNDNKVKSEGVFIGIDGRRQ